MGYSIEANSDSCYPNSTRLINKFDIKNNKKLAEIEAEITFAKAAVLESSKVKLPLDFEIIRVFTVFCLKICTNGQVIFEKSIFLKKEQRFAK